MLTPPGRPAATFSRPSAAPAAPVPARPGPDLSLLYKLLGLYIAMWVFEGALRKWVLPGLSNPLLVVRDPVLLVIYVFAFARGVFPMNGLVLATGVLSALAFAVSFVSTEVPIFIQVYGWRANYLHLPLIFVMAGIIGRDGVREVGKWFLVCAVPMSVLVTLQFLSGEGGFFNRGAGGTENGMLESAFGHIRPSGTFSFTNGLSGFISLSMAFFLHHLLERKVYNRWLWLAAAPALVTMITLSGSRAGIGLVGLIVATVFFVCLFKARYWKPAASLLVLGVLAFVALGSFAIFRDGLDVFAYRFGDSENVKVGFFKRAIDSLLDPYSVVSRVPLSGIGLGVGTNAGAAMLTGKRVFLAAEGEWPRVLMESGAILGTSYILLRISIVVSLGFTCMRSLLRDANTLPLLIFAGCFSEILQGQFAQPAGLGFATIAGALALAACRMPGVASGPEPARAATAAPVAVGIAPLSLSREQTLPTSAFPAVADAPPTPQPVPEAPAAPLPTVGKRGRSLYAERLHSSTDDDK